MWELLKWLGVPERFRNWIIVIAMLVVYFLIYLGVRSGIEMDEVWEYQ